MENLLNRLLGRPLATHEEHEQKVGPLAAVPMLGLDGLASAAYGPEAALVAAAALLLDYVLVVAVGISAGVGALVSALPSLTDHRLALCLLILGLIAFVNLRGIKESGVAWLIPTYGFLLALGAVLVVGLYQTWRSGGHPVPIMAPPALLPAAAPMGGLWLLVKAFAAGCTAMTGVEAVSNGMQVFREPAVRNAQRTLTIIVVSLALLLLGIAYLCGVYAVGATNPEGADYQSVVSQLTAAVFGRGGLYYVVIGFTLAVLALSANTGYADFPRLCRLLAEDDYLPHAFANRSRRLVYSLGIGVLTVICALLLIGFGGITDRLIPLFAVGAFGAFTLSQLGMVLFWRRQTGWGARVSMLINGAGALTTAVALIVILLAKFTEGAWVTVVLIPASVWLFLRVKGHYRHVASQVGAAGRSLDVSNTQTPLVVLPVRGWTQIAEKGLRFALRLSEDVIAVHVSTDDETTAQLQRDWHEHVEVPLRVAGRQVPELRLETSPYRRLFNPLRSALDRLKKEYPERQIAVIVSELVEAHWWGYLLHNQRAAGLKAALLLWGDNRVVVVSVPWYLDGR